MEQTTSPTTAAVKDAEFRQLRAELKAQFTAEAQANKARFDALERKLDIIINKLDQLFNSSHAVKFTQQSNAKFATDLGHADRAQITHDANVTQDNLADLNQRLDKAEAMLHKHTMNSTQAPMPQATGPSFPTPLFKTDPDAEDPDADTDDLPLAATNGPTDDPDINRVLDQIRQYEKPLVIDPPASATLTKRLANVNLSTDSKLTFKDLVDADTNLNNLYTIQQKLMHAGIVPHDWMDYLHSHFSPVLNARYAALTTPYKRNYGYGVAYLLQTYSFDTIFYKKQEAFIMKILSKPAPPWTWFVNAVDDLGPYNLLPWKAQFMTAFAFACEAHQKTLPPIIASRYQSYITSHKINHYMNTSTAKTLSFSAIRQMIISFYADCAAMLKDVPQQEQINAVRHSSSSNYMSNSKPNYKSKPAYNKRNERPQKSHNRQRTRTKNASSTKRYFCLNCPCAKCAANVKRYRHWRNQRKSKPNTFHEYAELIDEFLEEFVEVPCCPSNTELHAMQSSSYSDEETTFSTEDEEDELFDVYHEARTSL